MSSPLHAQVLRVTLRDSLSAAPVAAALVAATDSTGRVIAERLSDADGRAVLPLPGAATVQLRVRRIGIVPTVSPAVVVGAGETVPVALRVPRTRQPLPEVRVVDRCGDDARRSRAGVLWEQLAIALRSSELRRADSGATRTLIESRTRTRTLDRRLRLVQEAITPTVVGIGAPFVADDPDSLQRRGYVRLENAGTVAFYAPDDAVLASDGFRSTHCFSVPARDTAAGLAEVTFVPAPWRTMPDIAGSAWIDTASGEPRRVQFRYVMRRQMLPVPAPDAGGALEVQRVDDGTWIVSRWTIRVPLPVQDVRTLQWTLRGYREYAGESAPVAAASPIAASPVPDATHASTPVSPAPADASSVVRVAIAIVDAESGDGVRGVRVGIGESDEATSDADGIARFDVPPDRAVTLRVRRAMYAPLDTVLRGGRRDTALVLRVQRQREP